MAPWKKWKSCLKSLTKAMTYRMTSSTATFLATYALTGKAAVAFGVVGVEVFAKPTLYFLHERVWETKKLLAVFETNEGEAHA
jgi:uncharacterized membrane protein